jgi:hypothetical protein
MAAISLSALPLADVLPVANGNLPTRQVFPVPPWPDLSSPFLLVSVPGTEVCRAEIIWWLICTKDLNLAGDSVRLKNSLFR